MKEYGSYFNFDYKNNLYINSQSCGLPKRGLKSVYLRSGRECIRYCLQQLNNKVENALLPDYVCKSVVLPFEEAGLKIIYYNIDDKMTSQVRDEDLKEKTVYLFINYFGYKNYISNNILQIKKTLRNFYIIKDSTHDYFDIQNDYFMYKIVDFEICSLRKWVAIPDGGVVNIINDTFITNNVVIDLDESWAKTRIEAMKLKTEYIMNQENNLKINYLNIFSNLNTQLLLDKRIVGISEYSYQYISSYDFMSMYRQRKINISILHDELKDVINEMPFDEAVCSLYYPIIVNERDIIQETLANYGIYCPVIWPLPSSTLEFPSIARFLSNNILAIPCDQRYDINDMKYIAKTIKKIITNMKNYGVRK